jgi:hypothetical protein
MLKWSSRSFKPSSSTAMSLRSGEIVDDGKRAGLDRRPGGCEFGKLVGEEVCDQDVPGGQLGSSRIPTEYEDQKQQAEREGDVSHWFVPFVMNVLAEQRRD